MAVPEFLIVEPDADTAAILVRLCSDMRPSTAVGTFEDARRILEDRRIWCGVILELELPDGSGLNLLERLRAIHPFVPALVLTSLTEPAAINRVHGLRAEYHCKPTRRRALGGFLRHAVAFERTRDERIARIIEADAARFDLTPRESEILSAAVAGTSRKLLANQLGTTENTLKTQVRQLLRKCGHDSLEELGRYVLHQALNPSEPPVSMEREREQRDDSGPPTIRPSTGKLRTLAALEPLAQSGLVRTQHEAPAADSPRALEDEPLPRSRAR
jgi:DNA-binding NarL/FixJ family response regulator